MAAEKTELLRLADDGCPHAEVDDGSWEYQDCVVLAEQYLAENPDQEEHRAAIMRQARKIGLVKRRRRK